MAAAPQRGWGLLPRGGTAAGAPGDAEGQGGSAAVLELLSRRASARFTSTSSFNSPPAQQQKRKRKANVYTRTTSCRSRL